MSEEVLNTTKTRHKFSRKNLAARIAWQFICVVLFRPFSLRSFRKWRILLLNLFGAKIAWSCTVHSSVTIWAPWNLTMGDFSCLGPKVDCYNQGKITIGNNVIISQKVYLCASSHDHLDPAHPLILCPIKVEDRVWVAADSFVGPNVKIREGAVIGARSVVTKEMPAWTVCAGNPCKPLKPREMRSNNL